MTWPTYQMLTMEQENHRLFVKIDLFLVWWTSTVKPWNTFRIYSFKWISQDWFLKLGKFWIHINIKNLELFIISFTDAVEVMCIWNESMGYIGHIPRWYVSLDKGLVESIQDEYLVLLTHIRKVRPIETKSVVCLLHDRVLAMIDRFVCCSLIKHCGVDVQLAPKFWEAFDLTLTVHQNVHDSEDPWFNKPIHWSLVVVVFCVHNVYISIIILRKEEIKSIIDVYSSSNKLLLRPWEVVLLILSRDVVLLTNTEERSHHVIRDKNLQFSLIFHIRDILQNLRGVDIKYLNICNRVNFACNFASKWLCPDFVIWIWVKH